MCTRVNFIWPVLFVTLAAATAANAANHTAASCQQADVQAAVNAASDGDTVLIPNGSATWTGGISTTKQIIIRAQNYTPTPAGRAGPGTMTRNVTITNATPAGSGIALFQFTSGNGFHCGIGGIRFNETNPDVRDTGSHLRFLGSGTKVPLMFDCALQIKQRNGSSGEVAPVVFGSRGGVVWNCYFSSEGFNLDPGNGPGTMGFGVITVKDQPRAWTTPSTMGTLDTNGDINLYVEDTTFFICAAFVDLDDHGRAVYRYDKFDGTMGISHAFTSLWGGRHIECYNNDFVNTVDSDHPLAIDGVGRNWSIGYWLRGGTALFTDNFVTSANVGFGNPSMLMIGEHDPPSGQYLIPRQPACGHNGTNYVSDPVYIWNQTGNPENAYGYGYHSSGGWEDVVRLNRDLFVNSGPKPGYAKYVYPHPFRGGTPPPPVAPSITAQPANRTVNAGQTALFSVTAAGTAPLAYQWRKNAGNIAGATAASYTTPATTSADNGAKFSVVVSNSAGTVTSADATLTVTTPDTIAPTVSITAPAAGATVSGTAVTVSASASDNVGVAGVQFKLDGNNLGAEDTAAPYSLTWNSTAATNGSHALTAVARDAAGNTKTSAAVSVTVSNGGPPALPEGDHGIAARFPGDANIQSDANVLFADDFESYTAPSQLTTKWNETYHAANTSIETQASNVFAGTKSLLFKVPIQTTETSNTAIKYVNPTLDLIFVRCYTKFDAGFPTLGSSHNGLGIQANYSGPGIPANGTNKFYVGLENSGSSSEPAPGLTNLYVYHPEQRDIWGDHWYPTGRVVPFDSTPGDYGPYFVPRPDFTPVRDRWYCCEMMVKANTPGQRDGRIAYWIDGKLAADFLNVRLRDIDTLKIDKFSISLHINGTTNRVNMKWYDNVVAARSYIGPMVSAPATAPAITTQPVNKTVNAGQTATFSVTATGSAPLAHQWQKNGVNIAGATSATYTTPATVSADNGARFRVVVSNSLGSATSSEAVLTVLLPDTTFPAVTLTAPAAGATVSNVVSVSATASDNVGVAGVQFKLDGVNVGAEVTVSPYSVSWNTAGAANGSHTLTAVARDSAGNTQTSSAVAVTVANTLSASLVAAYSFDEGTGTVLSDRSGRANHGTVDGASWSSAGRYGGALSFDGTNDRVDVPDSASLDLTNGMTLEAWTCPTSTAGIRDILIKEGAGVDIYNLYACNGAGLPEINAFVSGSNQMSTGAALALNVWTHLAGTFDGSVLRLYVNGVQASSQALSGSIAISTGALRIGGNALWGEWFQGRIDEVRIYNRALSAAEIAADMNTPVAPVAPAITLQPASKTVTAGQTAAFSVTATGTAPLAYQWQKNGVNITGATASSYTTPATTTADSGATFRVIVTNAAGSATSANAVLTVIVPNTAPTITNIGDRTVNEDTSTGAIAFTVGDAQTAAGSLTLTRASSNATLVPLANITFGGSGASRTVTVTPVANRFGTCTVTITVSDGVLTASDSFVLTVVSVNDAPIANAGPDQTVEPGDLVTLDGSASHDPDAGPLALAYAWTIVSGPAATLSGVATSRATFTPATLGDYVFQLSISDGSASASDTVTVHVIDSTPPTVAVASVVLKGSVNGTGSAVTSVTVNGQAATLSGGTWSKEVTLSTGANLFTIVARDAAGQQSTATVQVTK